MSLSSSGGCLFPSVTVTIQRSVIIEELVTNTRAEHTPTGSPIKGGAFGGNHGKRGSVFPAEREAWGDVSQELLEAAM